MFNLPLSKSKSAVLAGASIVIMTFLAFGIFASLTVNALSVLGISIIIILDVVIGIALYYLLKSVNSTLAFWIAAARIVYAWLFAYALFNIFDLQKFYSIWDSALILFGLHLVMLGILIYKAKIIPKWLGILVLISGIGYVIDGTAILLSIETQVSLFTFFGELVFGFWLVVIGRKLSVKSVE